jgi:hypothetical protein
VDQAKAEVKARYGNKKRHRQWRSVIILGIWESMALPVQNV